MNLYLINEISFKLLNKTEKNEETVFVPSRVASTQDQAGSGTSRRISVQPCAREAPSPSPSLAVGAPSSPPLLVPSRLAGR